MAWIKMISLEEATGALKAMYEKYIEPVGVVDNILRIHSLNRWMPVRRARPVLGCGWPIRGLRCRTRSSTASGR